MALRDFLKKHENFIGALLLILVIMTFAGVRYDYYYDLNDDVLMKDILAGVYTGEPEGHNIQMLWLVSAFVSAFYRVARGLPWYGIFLCVCHYGSLFLIINRSLSFCRKRIGKLLLLLTEGVLILGLFLDHLVSAQYTVTCTLLASTAAFLFLTTDIKLSTKDFLKKNVGTVLLVFLAYLIRSEMLLLVLPLICVAGVIKWGSEKKIFVKDNFAKYLTVIGAILLAILAGQVSHRIAYGSSAWRTFTEYFDNRTELYDFQKLPEYDDHAAFYESVGLTESERELLDNYNFGLDEEIDEKLLGEIAKYASLCRSEEMPFAQRLRNALGNYVRRTLYGPSHNESDYPFNLVILLSYLAVFLSAMLIGGKKPGIRFLQIFWKLGFLGMVRTVLWVWLIMRDRVPVRISHSMYLMELCILGALLILQCRELCKENLPFKKYVPAAVCVLYLIAGAEILPLSVALTDEDVESKEESNVRYDALYSYLRSENKKDNFYFIDVYSSVAYTEKMFVNVDNSLANYDIMGGWACKSPLFRKKLAAFGIENMEEALTDRSDIYYVQEKGADILWLVDYYKDHGVSVCPVLTDTVDDSFEIYHINIREGKS